LVDNVLYRKINWNEGMQILVRVSARSGDRQRYFISLKKKEVS